MVCATYFAPLVLPCPLLFFSFFFISYSSSAVLCSALRGTYVWSCEEIGGGGCVDRVYLKEPAVRLRGRTVGGGVWVADERAMYVCMGDGVVL